MTEPAPVACDPDTKHTQPTNPPRTADVIWLAVFCSLLGGLGETLAWWTLRRSGRLIAISPDQVWMAPIANLIIFLIVGLSLALAMRLFCKRLHIRPVAAVMLFLSSLGVALVFPQIAWYSSIILSLGCAVIGSRSINNSNPGWRRVIKPAACALALVAITLGALERGGRMWNERAAVANLTTPRPDAPNVLLIVMDTVRAQSMSLYGYDRPTTPNLKRLAARGVRFDQAWSTSSWTLPSHASMFTGHYPSQLKTNWTVPLGDEHRTLAEAFRDKGYLTAGFVGNLTYCRSAMGLAQGFTHYQDFDLYPKDWLPNVSLTRAALQLLETLTGPIPHYLVSPGVVRVKGADRVNQQSLAWLDQHTDTGRPYFMFLNYFDAHAPYEPPAPYDTRFGPLTDQERKTARRFWRQYRPPNLPPEESRRAIQNAYDSSIAYLDHKINELLNQLDQRGLLDNTLVVVTADHGEQFGEHGLMDHGNSMYKQLLHLPLVIVYPPSVPANHTIDTPVSLRDLPATIVKLAGLSPNTDPFPGSSLSALWSGDSSAAQTISPVFSWAKSVRMYSIVQDGMHYVNMTGQEHVYRIHQDPQELTDLTEQPGAMELLMPFHLTARRMLRDDTYAAVE